MGVHVLFVYIHVAIVGNVLYIDWSICGALVQFGYYQHRYAQILRPHLYLAKP